MRIKVGKRPRKTLEVKKKRKGDRANRKQAARASFLLLELGETLRAPLITFQLVLRHSHSAQTIYVLIMLDRVIRSLLYLVLIRRLTESVDLSDHIPFE